MTEKCILASERVPDVFVVSKCRFLAGPTEQYKKAPGFFVLKGDFCGIFIKFNKYV